MRAQMNIVYKRYRLDRLVAIRSRYTITILLIIIAVSDLLLSFLFTRDIKYLLNLSLDCSSRASIIERFFYFIFNYK